MHQQIQPSMFYFGFPVVLLTTIDLNGNTNITPISSCWSLGKNVVIGLGLQGKAFENLQTCSEVVLNLPDHRLWQQVENIAPVTAKHPIPDFQQGLYQFCDNKFALGKFTAASCQFVKPARIQECPISAECRVKQYSPREGYAIIELEILTVHALPELIMDGNKINPEKWQPLIYNFRHYHGLTESLGRNFRA